MIDPVEHLARDDKWQLGAGDGNAFAPVFPQWLDAPGFWDDVTLLDRPVGPLFTVTVLDEEGREIPAHATARRWTPADLTVQYRMGQGLTATEVRTVHPGGIFVSEWRFAAYRPTRVHLVAWTAQNSASVERGSAAFDGALAFTRVVSGGRPTPMRVRAELACVGEVTSWCAVRAERTPTQPYWRLTPFVEKWRGGALPRVLPADADGLDGAFFAAVHRTLEVEYAGASATFALRLVPLDAALRPSAGEAPAAPRQGTLGGASRRRWAEYFESVPRFRCSDPYFETAYWYRWYGLRLHAVAGAPGNWKHPCVCEGPGVLHRPAALAAPAHIRELRWLPDPAAARGELLAFFAHQRRDGSLPPTIGVTDLDADGSHADWGAAMLALDALWPDDAFARKAHVKLAKFAAWLVKERDADGTGLFDAESTGARGASDKGSRQRKGITVTVYAYDLFRALERLGSRAGASAAETAQWTDLAERTRAAVRAQMWDASRGMFSDVDASTGARTGTRSAFCFLPYRSDLADGAHVEGLERHLLSTAEFWTPFPVPTLAADDPRFSAEGEWKGRRAEHPWNGRTWPSVNSHLLDALAHAARTHAPRLREAAATFLRRFVRMLFHGGELHRANCHEHYNPFTGHASVHRGLDDVQQAWLGDHILTHLMGIQPHDSGVTVDPLPLGLEHAEVRGVHARGRVFDVVIMGERVVVEPREGAAVEGEMGTPIELEGF